MVRFVLVGGLLVLIGLFFVVDGWFVFVGIVVVVVFVVGVRENVGLVILVIFS